MASARSWATAARSALPSALVTSADSLARSSLYAVSRSWIFWISFFRSVASVTMTTSRTLVAMSRTDSRILFAYASLTSLSWVIRSMLDLILPMPFRPKPISATINTTIRPKPIINRIPIFIFLNIALSIG